MDLKHICFSFLAVFYFSFNSYAQEPTKVQEQIKEHLDQALRYKEIALYGESMGELNQVIQLAKEHELKEEIIRASISKSELFRLTENFDRGIDILSGLKNTKQYPKLHVQKLGRLAALYSENGSLPISLARDSVKAFTQEAMEIAVRLNLKEEEAGLRNVIGFSQNRERKFDIALDNLQKAVDLYAEVGDQQNKLGAQINILDLYTSMDDHQKTDSLYPLLVKKIENSDWFSMQSKLYAIIAIRYRSTHEKIKELEWSDKAHQATVNYIRTINSNQMASFKVIHDTELFKNESKQKSNALERQKGRAQRLLLFISVLILIVVIVILIFFRERKLKGKLDTTVHDLNLMNTKYQVLIIESNHRIKNNLQMIISMLEFTKKGLGKSDTEIIQSMSGKIQTISALHKYLYVDVHNEHVDLNIYFSEILRHYKNIGFTYVVNKSICSTSIRSERIVYFGLILNEMLSNTLEHGRANDLVVELTVEESNGHYSFNYSDGSRHDENAREGTGMTLIRQLAGRVKARDYTMFPETGTYQFNFDADKID